MYVPLHVHIYLCTKQNQKEIIMIFNTLLDILREDEHFHDEIPYLGENIVYHGNVDDIRKTAESLQMACDMLKVPHIKIPVTFYAEEYQTLV